MISCRRLLSILVFLFTAQVGLAATLQGIVSDPLGDRVVGAQVLLQQGSLKVATSTTDGTGTFSFPDLTPGHYQIEVEARGFSTYISQEVSVASSGTTTLDVLVQLGTLKQGVVVTATGTATPLAQLGASVTLIDSDEIRTQNKLDVLEDLRQAPGVQITQTSQRGGIASLYIRGGEATFNKILVDGVPENEIGGSFDFAQLSNDGVQSIEILRGSNSVLYGADALAGVVNITTQRGTSPGPLVKYSVDGGNFHTYRNNVALSGMLGKFDYFSEFSRFDTQGSFTNEFFHNATYAGNVGFAPNSRTELRVTGRQTWTGLGSPNGINLYGISDDSSLKNQNTYLSGTFQNQTTERWHNLIRFGYGQFNQTYVNPTPTGSIDSFGDYLGNRITIKGANGYSVTGQGILDFAGAYPSIYPTYNARRSVYAQSDYKLSKDWNASFGFRYEHENGSGFTRDNYGYIMEANGNLGRRLYLTGGVGLENNAVFRFAASPRVSAAYYLRPLSSFGFLSETKLRANFGTGIKEPTTTQQGSELYALLTSAQRNQYAVDPIGPERSRTFDAGVDQGIFHGRARLEATFFQNKFYDLITYLNPTVLVSLGVPPGAAALTGLGAYVNANTTSSKGLEMGIVTELPGGLRIQANYTYLDAIVTKTFGKPVLNPQFPNIPIGAFSALQGQRPFHRAPHSGSFGLFYGKRSLTGSLTAYFVGRRDDSTFMFDAFYGNTMLLPNRNLAPAYQKVDLSGRYSLNSSVSLYTSIENLLSQHYDASFGFPAAPFTIRSGITLTVSGERR